MKYRYGVNQRGKITQLAKIYEPHEHTIKSTLLDKYYRYVFSRLYNNGHKVYVVGGAVRDMLLGNIPKDIDFITSARLTQAKRLLHGARIIGKRFPIVLIKTPEYQVEISSFIQHTPSTISTGLTDPVRSSSSSLVARSHDELFVSDVIRRDFTCNALYYDVITNQIIDFRDGVKHIREKILVALNDDYIEDPVRILRAYKYATICGFRILRKTKRAMSKHASLLKEVSLSRITEELSKLVCSRYTAPVLKEYYNQKLLCYILPNVFDYLSNLTSNQRKAYFALVGEYDTLSLNKEVSLIKLIGPYIASLRKEKTTKRVGEKTAKKVIEKAKMNRVALFNLTKTFLQPASFPNVWIRHSIARCLQQGVEHTASTSVSSHAINTRRTNPHKKEAHHRTRIQNKPRSTKK